MIKYSININEKDKKGGEKMDILKINLYLVLL